MNLVIRSNYGDDSIALIEALYNKAIPTTITFDKVYVVYIDTGWAGSNWLERVAEGERYVQACGFEAIRLKSKASFAELVIERKNFPSQKFQWCAGFLKGLPLLEWLDENDPGSEWIIALPKRQALYRTIIPEIRKECPYHGERDVWHPILQVSDMQRDKWVTQAGFSCLYHRSLECEPCVNSTLEEFDGMSESDKQKTLSLQLIINKKMFNIITHTSQTRMDAFTMGCGDPFACGI